MLLTHDGRHGFYLDADSPEPIFIRCGFTSGYSGEGPAGLAIALHLLERFSVETDEVEVPERVLNRLDACDLRPNDLEAIEKARVVRPLRLHDYKRDGLLGRTPPPEAMRNQFSGSIPWRVLDERLVDLALLIGQDPDRAIFNAFRRLEVTVKSRCGLPGEIHGVQVFRRAFRGAGAILSWPGLAASEVEGRAQLFEAAFLAYRNPRAHREVEGGVELAYREFYIVNELFSLEREAEAKSDR
ncbi:hypothetical protein GCM10023332_06030 [Luteimonas vadosa]|uniref:Conserved hypothetical protein CHP02391 domain-containing protein n=1 Tax=Luteimonas vadosa TaxID=1165507 RepID=A0ABP9DV29_9GAMM